LGDLDRLDVGPELGERGPVRLVEHELLGIVAGVARHRYDAVILDVENRHRVQVERDDDAFDRSGVAVLGGRRPHGGQRPADQRGVRDVVLCAVVPRRPGVDHRQREVGDPALAHCLLPAGVLPDDTFTAVHVLAQVGREAIRHRRPGHDRRGAEVDDPYVQGLHGVVVGDDEGGPRRDRLEVEVAARGLGRFLQRDHHEPEGLGAVFASGDRRGGELDLRRCERVERMGSGRRVPRWH